MLEYSDEVIFGLQVLLKATGAEKGIIAVEDNNKSIIDLFIAKTNRINEIGIIAAKTKYPQGAEKMLIKYALNRHVPSGGLPFDVGVIVSNVGTVRAIADVIQAGLPLIYRVATVTGERIKHPGNYIVKTGTSVKEIIDYCGGSTGEATFKLGGPMMGIVIDDLNIPVIKGTNGIIAIDTSVSKPSPCIRCGRCVDVCPMELLPLYYPQYAGKANWEGMEAKEVMNCLECGCCEFICPSKIAIIEAVKIGKKALTPHQV
jgi:electron transport complex protein RnfC